MVYGTLLTEFQLSVLNPLGFFFFLRVFTVSVPKHLTPINTCSILEIYKAELKI